MIDLTLIEISGDQCEVSGLQAGAQALLSFMQYPTGDCHNPNRHSQRPPEIKADIELLASDYIFPSLKLWPKYLNLYACNALLRHRILERIVTTEAGKFAADQEDEAIFTKHADT